ncbi:MAG: ABC transporter ATP-binding protein [Chloroflexota bacterium]
MTLLKVKGLHAGYGKLTILHQLNLSVESGQFMAVLGPNGSGKSTLIKSIYGLTDIFSGTIQMQGQDLVSVPTEQISQSGLAYVPQRENIFSTMTIRENLQLALRHQSATQKQSALDELFELFPVLAERQRQRAEYLSGGERQMVAIALAYLTQPQMMLLDEPSAGLAPRFVKSIFSKLRQLCDMGITLLVVEQNARSLLQWCDYAYILREGRVAFHGSAADTLSDEETVKGYLGVSTQTQGIGV